MLDVVMVINSLAYLIGLSPDPAVAAFSWGLLLVVTVCINIGKRSMETSHRIAFIHIANERALRAEAEHQLSFAAPNQSDRPRWGCVRGQLRREAKGIACGCDAHSECM